MTHWDYKKLYSGPYRDLEVFLWSINLYFESESDIFEDKYKRYPIPIWNLISNDVEQYSRFDNIKSNFVPDYCLILNKDLIYQSNKEITNYLDQVENFCMTCLNNREVYLHDKNGIISQGYIIRNNPIRVIERDWIDKYNIYTTLDNFEYYTYK